MHYSIVATFAAVSLAIIVIPGPSVLFAVGRAISAGRRTALLTVLGNASGVFVQILFIALGLGVIVTGSDTAHVVLRMAGAAYLLWLGLDAIRHRHATAGALDATDRRAATGAWRDGFVVGVSNPKTAVFLAALLPQYVDPGAGFVAGQMVLLGAVFCGIAIVGDGAWTLLAARARSWLASDPRRLVWTSVAGGLVMIVLGLLLLVG